MRIAVANASATLFTKVQANLYGTPEDVAKVNEAFLRGQRAASSAGGFFAVADPKTLEAMEGAGTAMSELVSAVLARLRAPNGTTSASEAPSNGGHATSDESEIEPLPPSAGGS